MTKNAATSSTPPDTDPNGYFLREGAPVTGCVRADEKGRPYTVVQEACGRCGGEGGSDRWCRTGYTCFACGGARFFNRSRRVYTKAELETLNSRREKRRATLAAKRAKAEAERKAMIAAERDEKYVEFSAENADVIEALNNAANVDDAGGFLREMFFRLSEHGYLTERQRDAVREAEAKRAFQRWLRKQNRFLWEPGQRVEAEVVWERVIRLKSNNYLYGDSFLHIGKCEGATVVYKGSRSLVPWCRSTEYRDAMFPVVPYVTQLRASVKDHEEYNGTLQTRLARPKVLSEYDPLPRSEE